MEHKDHVGHVVRQVVRLLLPAIFAVLLLLISGGVGRTEVVVSEEYEAPNCKNQPYRTAITAVYCAYKGSIRFGKPESNDEPWGKDGDRKQRFQFGTIYYVHQSRAAYALFNHVRDYYEGHQDLGKPITSEIGSADKGFCKAFFTGDYMLECRGVNNPVLVNWHESKVHLPKMEMPFNKDKTGTYNGGPHTWGSEPTTISGKPGSGLDIGFTGEVYTVASGTVIEISNNNNNPNDCNTIQMGLGCWIAIRNDFSGTVIVYGHLKPNSEARVGHWIKAGTDIGMIDDCGKEAGISCIGRSDGPHVHLELRDGRSKGASRELLWGNPLSWHGVSIDEYLFSGGVASYNTFSNELGNTFDYDGTAVIVEPSDVDVHRLYSQPEMMRLLDEDDYIFEKFSFSDYGIPKEMYAWMTQEAWEKCQKDYNKNCETKGNYENTVFAYGTLGEIPTMLRTDESEPILLSTNEGSPYDPLFSPPDNPSDPVICIPTADQVAIYDDAGYGPTRPCKLLNVGNHDSLGSLDNATSSVRVGANVKLTLYAEPNRSGASETFISDDPDLADNETIQRDEASSAVVQSKGGGSGGCQPNDYQAALFDDVYFNPNKPCRLLDIGDYSSLDDLTNITSSVKVGRKVVLVLFEDTDFGSPNETFYHDDYNLADNDHIRKNEASSAKVILRDAGGNSFCNDNQSPGETEVILFDNPRYGGGPCAKLKVGEYPDLSTISFENLASSLRVGSQVKVIVCTKKNYDESEESGGECETYKGDVPDLDEEGEVPRNETSSARVEMRLLCNPLADGVTLYESSNYQDGCTTLTTGTWNLSDFRYNDIVSSLRFVGTYSSGWSAKLCQGENLTGTCSTFVADDVTLSGDAVGNDRASSIAIAPLPPTLAPTLMEITNPEGLSTYQANWTDVAHATGYELEELTEGGEWANVYIGEAINTVLLGKSQGEWCYRARATNSAGAGPWSEVVCTTVAPPVPDPDLKVNSITPDDPLPTVGQSIAVNLVIQNAGEGAAGPSSCTLYEGDPAAGGIQVSEADCVTLSPSANGAIAFDWVPTQAGQVELYAMADSDNILVETDEGNNSGFLSVEIQPQVVECYELTLTHTGQGADPVSQPANSAGCLENNYEAGTTITLTADPASGWRVQGWSGTTNDAAASEINSVVMPAAEHSVGVAYEILSPTAPTITAFMPSNGPVGTAVTIIGTNLTEATTVTFNGTVADAVTVVSPTQIDTTVPLGATTGRITVITPNGTATSATDFTVTEALDASFFAFPTWGDAPLTVDFYNTSTGQATSWLWEFGDGETSTDWSPTHIYYMPGTYSVSLTIDGPAGSDTITQTAYIQVFSPGTTQFLFLPSVLSTTTSRGSGDTFPASSEIRSLAGRGTN